MEKAQNCTPNTFTLKGEIQDTSEGSGSHEIQESFGSHDVMSGQMLKPNNRQKQNKREVKRRYEVGERVCGCKSEFVNKCQCEKVCMRKSVIKIECVCV